MLTEKKGLYVVFSGHMCTGKDTIIEGLKERGVLHKKISDGVHFMQEAVNHDQDVLHGYYSNMSDTTEFFELGTLCFRSVLSSQLNKKQGLVIGNRHVIEARRTFVEHSRKMTQNGKKFFDETATGMYDMLLRRAMEKGIVPIPDIVFFLYVEDPNILIKRNRGRNDPGENSLDPNYLLSLQELFEDYRKEFSQVHRYWGIKVPKLVEINVSYDMKEDKKYLTSVLEKVELEILNSYQKLKNIPVQTTL